MNTLYHCSDCGQNVTATDGEGGLHCDYCKSGRVTLLTPAAETVAPVVPVVVADEVKPTAKPHKVRAKKTRVR